MYTEGSIRFHALCVFMNLKKLFVFPCKESKC